MLETKPTFSVVGAGAWGSAIALHLSTKGEPVAVVYQGSPSQTLASKNIMLTTSIAEAAQAKYLFLAIPSESIVQVIEALAGVNDFNLIVATKGLGKDGRLLSDIIEEKMHVDASFLAGPNFASEVASGVPSAAMIGSKHMEVATDIAQRASSSTFRLVPTDDIYALQVAGCIKNIAAVVAGALDGIGWGENSKAWVFSIALEEIALIASAIKRGKTEVANLGVAGDLALCFYSKASRNHTFGRLLSQLPASERRSFIESYPLLVEGKRNLGPLRKLAESYGLKSRIADALQAALQEPEDLEEELLRLLQATPLL